MLQNNDAEDQVTYTPQAQELTTRHPASARAAAAEGRRDLPSELLSTSHGLRSACSSSQTGRSQVLDLRINTGGEPQDDELLGYYLPSKSTGSKSSVHSSGISTVIRSC